MNDLLEKENGNPNIFKCVNETMFWNPQRIWLISERIVCSQRLYWSVPQRKGLFKSQWYALAEQLLEKKPGTTWITRFPVPDEGIHWKMMPLQCAFFSGEFHHHEMVTAVVPLTKFVPITSQPLSKQEWAK